MIQLVILCCILVLVDLQPITKTDDPCPVVVNHYNSRGRKIRDCTLENGYVYWRIEDSLNWNESRIECQSFPKGDLMGIHSYKDRVIANAMGLNNHLTIQGKQNTGVWIGLYRPGFYNCSEPFVWANGRSTDYTDWLDGEPNCFKNKNEYCVQLSFWVNQLSNYGAGWNDNDCDSKLKSLCEVKH